MDAQFDQKILFDMLRDIDQAEMSGVLELHTGKEIFLIYLQGGFVVYAVERLITTGEHLEFTKRQAIHLGRVSQGKFRFDGAAESPVINDWQLRAADLIMEAARFTSDEEKLRAHLGDPERHTVGPVYNIDERTRGLLLTPSEFSMLSQLEVPMTLKTLGDQLGIPLLDVMRGVFALCSAGILDAPVLASSDVDSGTSRRWSSEESDNAAKVQQRNRTIIPVPAQPIPAASAPPMAKTALADQYTPPAPVEKPPVPKPAPSKPRSKLNTGALERLAGVKIRSMSGDSEDNGTTPESEQFYQQGSSMLKNGNIAGAESMLRKAISLAPNYAPYLIVLGRLLAKQPKRQKEAEGFLMKACSEDMNAIEPRMLLADIYEALGMKAKGETMLKSVLNISPDYKPAQTRLAEMNKGSSWGDFFRWKK